MNASVDFMAGGVIEGHRETKSPGAISKDFCRVLDGDNGMLRGVAWPEIFP